MHYWNQANFEALALLEQQLGRDDLLRPLARFCALRVQGLRQPALAVAREFVQAAAGWARDDRQRAVARLMELLFAHRDAHQFLVQPLLQDFVLPALIEWQAAAPGLAAPVRWRALLLRELALLERALQLDPDDDDVRRALIDMHLDEVQFQAHHLGEGQFLGEVAHAETSLATAAALLAARAGHVDFATLQREWRELREQVDDWCTFRRSPAPKGTFVEWCAARGRAYAWPRAYYYGQSDGSPGTEPDEPGR